MNYRIYYRATHNLSHQEHLKLINFICTQINNHVSSSPAIT